MGLCAQAVDERGRAGWNAEGEKRKKEKEKKERIEEEKKEMKQKQNRRIRQQCKHQNSGKFGECICLFQGEGR